MSCVTRVGTLVLFVVVVAALAQTFHVGMVLLGAPGARAFMACSGCRDWNTTMQSGPLSGQRALNLVFGPITGVYVDTDSWPHFSNFTTASHPLFVPLDNVKLLSGDLVFGWLATVLATVAVVTFWLLMPFAMIVDACYWVISGRK